MPHKTPEARRAYMAKYREKNKARMNAYAREWKRKKWAEDEEYRRKSKARLDALPMEARRAHNAVQRAIKRGDLVRPDHCEKCFKEAFIEAAHDDYSKPLDVCWLCRSCHRRQDYLAPRTR